MPRSSLGAKHPVAPFDDVQVNLEDAFLVEDRLPHQGDQYLLALAQKTSLTGQKQAFRQLLGNGGAAGNDLAFALVSFHGLLDAFPIATLMIDKSGILGYAD